MVVFACHKTHMLHNECYEAYKKFNEKNKTPLICPICREPIVKDKIEKTRLLEADAKAQTYDPFSLRDDPPKLPYDYLHASNAPAPSGLRNPDVLRPNPPATGTDMYL